MRVLVTGGRTYSNREHVFEYLDLFHSRTPITLLIHGNAKGADALAKSWAKSRGVKQLAFDANWDFYGSAAGPIRNTLMFSDGKPGKVIAFPGGKGTADCVAKAKALNIEVFDGRLTTTPGSEPFGLSRL